MNRQSIKNSTVFFLILLVVFLISGCNSFTINKETVGKKVKIIDRYYYVYDQSSWKKIEIMNGNNYGIICDFCGNKQDVNAFAIAWLPPRKITRIKNFIEIKPSSKSSILLIWENKKIYEVKMNNYLPREMKWISKDQLLLRFNFDGKNTKIVDKYGKLIKVIDEHLPRTPGDNDPPEIKEFKSNRNI